MRGAEISMIFQEPMTSLNPVMTIGAQVSETIRLHQDLPKAAEYFEKALAVDPTLVQVQNVLERIREVLRQRRQQSI